ncbi:uncharacterized protein E0L32_008183 [Thyridium curvatum]|uniref:Proteophosphoglycan 5 n=1 Tax=Thyridium curvatum TaxID=1093900 RepID=A0A507AWJ6_9PEZI|nr:uncharacterized protein E0L32_008183 [Thyridium curvatum]TPX10794.1 hypothetical protein E0L32_008183 [Thyridium curvatum]
MQTTNLHSKQTPGRRRQARRSNQSPAQRNYASENDMPDPTFHHQELPDGGPATPLKSNSNSPAPASTSNNKSSKRNGNKSRPKNVSTSPAPMKQGRRTPPQTGGPKSASAAAFAGATFHASPAPSSLPIPSFFAKTATESPRDRPPNNNTGAELSPPLSDAEVSSPGPRSPPVKAPREESPLDIFFRADRAEKQKARSNSGLGSAIGPFSPPQTLSPQESNPFVTGSTSQQGRRPQFQRKASNGISTTELDGTPGKPMGPAFSTPYSERIKAARSSERSADNQHSPLPQRNPASDASDALKRFLFSGQQPAAAPHHSTNGSFNTPSAASVQPTRAAMPEVQHVYATSPAHHTSQNQRSANVVAMEDSLRQILKLDSSLSLGSPTSHRS